MFGISKLSVALACPECGNTGVGTIKTGRSGKVRAVNVPDGFVMRTALDTSLHIDCSNCASTVYEIK
jgi:hypothetical protein